MKTLIVARLSSLATLRVAAVELAKDLKRGVQGDYGRIDAKLLK